MTTSTSDMPETASGENHVQAHRTQGSRRKQLRGEFTEFYEQSYPRAVMQVRAITGDPVFATMAVKLAMTRAWIQWGCVRRLEDPESWVRRAALRGPRWRGRAQRAALPRLSEQELSSMDPRQLAVLGALLRQPKPERHSLVLRHMAGLSVDRIAQEEGVAAGTVVARLERGRQGLAELLGNRNQSTDTERGMA